MLRSALQCHIRPILTAQSRPFVSTVLLTRNWENETISALRREARERGLSNKGNKATLITRLQEHDNRISIRDPPPSAKTLASTAPSPVTQQVRQASSAEVPGIPSTSELHPIPPSFPREFLDVKIPVPSDPTPEAPVPVPFLPDLWDSSRIKRELAQTDSEPSAPNVIAVAGDASHINANSHKLYSATPELRTAEQKDTRKLNIIADIAEDLGIGQVKIPWKDETPKLHPSDIPEVTGPTGGGEGPVVHPRPLNEEERTGLWVLFGILFGSWFLAGAFKPESALAKEEKHASTKEQIIEGAKTATK